MQSLTKELKSRLKGYQRLAILGIGSEFRGDDVAGMLVAERIEKVTKSQGHKGTSKRTAIKVFFGATAPENLTGEIIKFKPTHIIMVDTADIKQKPGTIILLDPAVLGEGVSFSTHKLPARVMMDYFTKILKCGILLIGIQPKGIIFGKPVSKEVNSSVKEVSSALISAVKSKPGS